MSIRRRCPGGIHLFWPPTAPELVKGADHGPGVGFEGQGAGISAYPGLRQPGGKDPGRAAGSPHHLRNLRHGRRLPPEKLSIQGHRHHPEGQAPDQRGRSGFARNLPGDFHCEKITLGGTEQLLLNKTEATTNLVVQDGQTIVIGGLIREDTTKAREGVPFLYRIPFIGWLFGEWNDGKTRQELIILLTPRVIKNQKDAKKLSAEFIDNMSEASEGRIKKEELHQGKAAADTRRRQAAGAVRNRHPRAIQP